MARLALAACLLVAGCIQPVKYERPAVELPEAWKEAAPRFVEDGRWWRIYDDAALDALVEEALSRNGDLLVAAARVDEARALLGEANSFFWPQVEAQASSSRQQISTRTATSFPGIPTQYTNNRATLNVSYELDLFGRLRANSAAARAELEASEASREAVRVALAAQVAKSYFALRSLDEQVDLTRRTVALREQALDLQRKRLRGGVISQFELRQLEAEAAVVRAQLPPLERDREREEVSLAVLLGRTPKQLFDSEVKIREAYDEMPGPPVLPAGVPSELLLRRPDLVEAERQLAAANARVAVARAEMFPSISLTAFYGSESAALANLFAGGSAGARPVAPAPPPPLFAGGSPPRPPSRSSPADASRREPTPPERASAPCWRNTFRPSVAPSARCGPRSSSRRARKKATMPNRRAPRRSAKACASPACATTTASRASSTCSMPSVACSPPRSRASRHSAPTARR